jgi:probable phosphoglycerate mutase
VGVEFDGWWDVHAHVVGPGAETPEELARRVLPAFGEVLERLGEGETAVVVTHGASLRVAIAGILGWPVEAAGGLEAMRNCAWAVLAETGPGRLRLSSYNQTGSTLPPD